jgi:translation elongation factor EF-Tu-like GTPase
MKRFDGTDDFEATIRIFREDEGGRRSPVFNGIRWDFCYAETDPKDGIWMIHPHFHDARGESIPEEQALPVDVSLPARMFIVVDEMRDEIHRRKVRVGGRFYCHEGARRVAEGVITEITGLFRERNKAPNQ